MTWEQHNADQQSRYTSTGPRILYHPDAIANLRAGRNHPVTMHIMPTERCNLNCTFCSVGERNHYPDLPLEWILSVVNALEDRGLKAVILSGGGEPMLYRHINELLSYLCGKFEVGVITNGTVLHKMDTALLNRLTWVRVSANTLDYLDKLELPVFTNGTTLGLSYIWHEYSTLETAGRITDLAARSKAKYIRLVPDCTVSTEELEKAHEKLHSLAQYFGPPWFHQYKIHKAPAECHLGRIHPVLYADGLVYPCDSLVLNSPRTDRRFRAEYAMCRWDEVAEFFDRPIAGSLLDTKICPHCIFWPQNEILTDLINKVDVPLPNHPTENTNFV